MRSPLPLFSASEPSGLKIRSAARAAPGCEGLTSSKIPSAPSSEVPIAYPADDAPDPAASPSASPASTT